MHIWGEEGVDWEGISAAAAYIGEGLRKWGRVNVVQYKEKYGTVRVYCSLGWWQIHAITHPGYAASQYPHWLWALDCKFGSLICRALNYIVIPYHKWLYRRYYRMAVQKWPHLRHEIICVADYPDLLDML